MHLDLPENIPLITEKMIEAESAKLAQLLVRAFTLNEIENAKDRVAPLPPILFALNQAIRDGDLALSVMHAIRIAAYEKLANGWEDYELIRESELSSASAPSSATKH